MNAENNAYGFTCHCGFTVSGATESEAEWIGDQHRALQHEGVVGGNSSE